MNNKDNDLIQKMFELVNISGKEFMNSTYASAYLGSPVIALQEGDEWQVSGFLGENIIVGSGKTPQEAAVRWEQQALIVEATAEKANSTVQ